MIVGVNLGNQIDKEITYFAFWNTVVDKFIEIAGSQAWTCWEECEEDCRLAEFPIEKIERLKRVCPFH